MKLLKQKKLFSLLSIALSLSILLGTISPTPVLAQESSTDNETWFDGTTLKEIEQGDEKYQENYDSMIEEELNGNSKARLADPMLLKSQQWLNENFSGKTGYIDVPEDGTSRRSTVNGCIRALQVKLGITDTATNIGDATTTKLKAAFDDGIIKQQADDATAENEIYGIIQCALWTKGYSTGSSTITKHFYGGTGAAIIELKTDMGFENNNSDITIPILKALLSMNYFVKVSGGSDQIRQIQQEINRTYPTYVGILPCDGVYSRSMNKALIIVLQALEGYKENEATGHFGDGTKSNLPLDLVSTDSWLDNYENYQKTIKLVQYALCCNGYGKNIDLSNSVWNSNLSSIVKEFQGDMNLEQTGTMDVNTWMALLLSKGNPDRSCNACDTNRPVYLPEQISYLKNNGISVIGRYLSSSTKGITNTEANYLLENGISFFPIFQEVGGDEDITAFTSNRAKQDATSANAYAKQVGLKEGSIIYFAVDFDPTDYEISSYVLPYFDVLNDALGDYYQIGVYGTRNVCTQVMENNYAVTCFISDMSTGYSGNMGYKMPENWNLDQFAEVTTNIFLEKYNINWKIDKVSYKGSFPVITSLDEPSDVEPIYTVTEGCFVLNSEYPSNTGLPRLYDGRKLFVSITLTGENGEVINDGTQVTVGLHLVESSGNDDPFTTLLPIYLVNATPDGTTYTLEDFDGMLTDYAIIEENTHYYLDYSLRSGSTSPVKVKVTIESTPY